MSQWRRRWSGSNAQGVFTMVGIAGRERFEKSSSRPVRQFAKPSSRPVANPSAYVASLVLLLLGLGVSAATAQSLFLGSNRTGVWVGATQPASGLLQLGLSYGGSAQRVTFLYQKPGTETWSPATGTMAVGPPGSPNWVSSSMPMAACVDGALRVKAEVEPYGGAPITVGPQEFALKNLTVDEIRCEAAQGGEEVVEAGELFMAVTSPTTVEYEVDLLDGYECPTEASANLTLRLLPLGVGQTRQATTTGTAPTTMTGVFGTPLPIGFYYKEATASEPATYDTASNLSSFWHLTNVALTGYEYMGGRKARITVEGVLDTAALPSAESFAWCKPLPTAAGRPVPPGVLTVPAAAYTVDLGDVLVTFGGSTGLDLSVAGVNRLAMAFRDTRQYHAPSVGRWTAPQAVTVEIPAAACYTGYDDDDEDFPFAAMCSFAYSRLGSVPAVGDQGATFYSAAYEEGVRGGVVDTQDATKQPNFLKALQEDEVVFFCGHGTSDALYLTSNILGQGWMVSQEDIGVLNCGQIRLAYLCACHSAVAPAWNVPSLAHAVYERGATVSVGVDGPGYAGDVGSYFNERLWTHWATAGMGIWDGYLLARQQTELMFPGEAVSVLRMYPYHANTSVLVPAFTVG